MNHAPHTRVRLVPTLAMAIGCVIGGTSSLLAADWTASSGGAVSGNWGSTSDSGSAGYWTMGADTVVTALGTASIGVNIASDTTITMNTAGGVTTALTIGDTDASNAYTIAGSSTLSLAGTLTQRTTSKGDTISAPITLSNNLSITNGSANVLTFSGIVSGSGNAISIAGPVLFTAANTYNGGTTVSSGTATTTAVAGFGTGTVTVNTGATAALAATASTDLTYANAFAGAGTVAVTAPATGTKTANLTGSLANFTGTLDINPSGVASNGKARFSCVVPTTSANVNIRSGGTLYLSDANKTWPLNVTLNGGTTGETLGQLRIESGTTISGTVALAANTTIGGNGSTNTLSGVVSGSFGFTKVGTGTLVLSAANTYTGVTTVSAGTLQIGNGGTTGSIASSSGVTGTGGTLAIKRSDDIVQSAGTALPNVPLTGSTIFSKQGTNTLTMDLANTYVADTFVSAGTLTLTGSLQAVGKWIYVADSTTNARFNIVSGTSTYGAVRVGVNSASTGVVYQTGGSMTTSLGGTGDTTIGAANNAYGYYSLNSGTLTANEVGIGGLFTNTTGVMDVSGGTLDVSVKTTDGYICLGRGTGTSSGILNITGGTASAVRVELDWAANAAGATSVVNVANGTLTTTGSATLGLNLAVTNTAGTLGVANLLTGGVATTGIVTASGANSTTHLNFNGGTLKAAAINAGTGFLTSGNIDAVNVYAAGGVIDNNGTNITVSRPLAALTGYGVSSVAITNAGAGYIGVPMVKITGGTGTGATAYATMSGGSITGIVITSPGIGYTSGDTVTATLTGGGATTAAVLGTVTLAANTTTGGMAFAGSGTTTLSGVNTYTGATTVSAGTVAVTGSLASASASVASGATLTLASNASLTASTLTLSGAGTVITTSGDMTIGSGRTITPSGALALNPAATLTFSGGTLAFTPSSLLSGATITSTSTVASSGTTTVQIGSTLGAFDVTSAQSFKIFDGATTLVLSTFTLSSSYAGGGSWLLARGDAVSGGDDTQLYVVFTPLPSVSSVAGVEAADTTVKAGGTRHILVTMNEAVTVTGTPSITLATGGIASYDASYTAALGDTTSTILAFTYTVGSSDSQTRIDYGTTEGALALNGGSIVAVANSGSTVTADLDLPGTAGSNALYTKNWVVDRTAPILTGVASSDAVSGETYGADAILHFSLSFDDSSTIMSLGTNGSIIAQLNSGGSATCSSVAAGFVYTVGSRDATPTGETLTVESISLQGDATIQDVAGNDADLSTNLPITIVPGFAVDGQLDTTAPMVASVTTTTTSGSYGVGTTFDLVVTFDESVFINASGGLPTLTLNAAVSGGTAATAAYVAGVNDATSTTTLHFTYTVAANEVASTLTVDAINLNGAIITDLSTHPNVFSPAAGAITVTVDGTTTDTYVIDGVAPTVSSVVGSPVAGSTILAGGSLQVTVNFSEPVTWAGSADPALACDLNGTSVTGTLVSGKGSSSLVFTVWSGSAPTLTANATLTLVGFASSSPSIVDATGVNALANQSLATSWGLSAVPIWTVQDGTAPTLLTLGTSAASGTQIAGGATVTVTLGMSEAMTWSGSTAPTLQLVTSRGTSVTGMYDSSSSTSSSLVYTFTAPLLSFTDTLTIVGVSSSPTMVDTVGNVWANQATATNWPGVSLPVWTVLPGVSAELTVIMSPMVFSYDGSAHEPTLRFWYQNTTEITDMVRGTDYTVTFTRQDVANAATTTTAPTVPGTYLVTVDVNSLNALRYFVTSESGSMRIHSSDTSGVGTNVLPDAGGSGGCGLGSNVALGGLLGLGLLARFRNRRRYDRK